MDLPRNYPRSTLGHWLRNIEPKGEPLTFVAALTAKFMDDDPLIAIPMRLLLLQGTIFFSFEACVYSIALKLQGDLHKKFNFLKHNRLNFFFTVQALSQFMQHPLIPHYEALLHTLHYVQCTVGCGIMLNGCESLVLTAYSDFEFIGYFLLLCMAPISSNFAKAENRVMAQASAKVRLVRLLEDFGAISLTLITLHCDNSSALLIAKNLVFDEGTKHIKVDSTLVMTKS
ncbi:hypothetical protein V2J09_022672 [Rumex salicifolius]